MTSVSNFILALEIRQIVLLVLSAIIVLCAQGSRSICLGAATYWLAGIAIDVVRLWLDPYPGDGLVLLFFVMTGWFTGLLYVIMVFSLREFAQLVYHAIRRKFIGH